MMWFIIYFTVCSCIAIFTMYTETISLSLYQLRTGCEYHKRMWLYPILVGLVFLSVLVSIPFATIAFALGHFLLRNEGES